MLRSSIGSASVVLLAATSFAQGTPQAAPITPTVQYAGVLHLATGTWTMPGQGGGSQPVSGPGIIYDNTCLPSNSYLPVPVGAKITDEGRLPAMNSVVIPNTNGLGNDSEVGTQNSYTIDGFRFAYCTKATVTRSYTINFYEAYNSCSTPPAPTASFNITGLPGTTTANLVCYYVDIDLSDCNAGGTPLSFNMQADADGTYNGGAGGMGDTFGWSFVLTSTPANSDGIFIAGGPPSTPGGSYTTASGSDGTVFDSGTVSSRYPDNSEAIDLGPPPVQCGVLAAGATPESGTGMGSQDAFRIENWPGVPGGCYNGAAMGPGLMGSFYLQIYSANVELPSNLVPPLAYCDPGVGSIIACPCSNPPSGAGRGCNNSASTGGASMVPAGLTSLSTPTLQFTTAGEKPTAGSILIQGTIGTNGVGFGQGVRCTGGVIKRLYFRNAVAGSITLPNFGLGDLDIPTRSAAVGNPINPGENRWYQVYYRDGTVVGGCPSSLQFNITNGSQITWN
jgi:hypothetical protein